MLLKYKELVIVVSLMISCGAVATDFPGFNIKGVEQSQTQAGIVAVIRYVDWKAKTIQLRGQKYRLSTGVDVKGVNGEQLRGDNLKPKMKVAFILGKSATNTTVVKQIKVLKDNVGNETDI